MDYVLDINSSSSPSSYQSYYTNGFHQYSPNSFSNSALDASSSFNSSFYYGTSSPINYFPLSHHQPNNIADNYSFSKNYQFVNYSQYNYATSQYQPLANSTSNHVNASYWSDSAYNSMITTTPVDDEPGIKLRSSKKRKLDLVADEEPQQLQQAQKSDVNKKPRVFKLTNPNMYSQTFCKICSIEFNSIAKFLIHTSKIHNQRSGNECPICFKTFGTSANAMVHVKAHTQERTYKCDYCDGTFCDSSTLKKHLRTHTGEKPYACAICSKTFSQSGNLKRHLTIHSKQDMPPEATFETVHPSEVLPFHRFQLNSFEPKNNFAFLNNSTPFQQDYEFNYFNQQ